MKYNILSTFKDGCKHYIFIFINKKHFQYMESSVSSMYAISISSLITTPVLDSLVMLAKGINNPTFNNKLKSHLEKCNTLSYMH